MPIDLLATHGIASLPTPLAAALAIGFGHVMFSLFTSQEFAANALLCSIKFGFVVEIHAAVAALTLVGLWNIYQTSRDTLQKEVGAMYMLALTVDCSTPEGVPIRISITGWPASRTSERSIEHAGSGAGQGGYLPPQLHRPAADL